MKKRNKINVGISAIIFLLIVNTIHSQEITNSLNYEINYYGIRIISFEEKKIKPSFYLVEVELPKGVDVGKYSKSDWMMLLSDNDTDFIANLILHQCYSKDATHLLDVSKNHWRKCCKEKSIEFWGDFL